jgi:hypothetical protein
MAYNVSTQAQKLLPSVGSYSGFAVGLAAASATTVTVACTSLRVVHGVVATSIDSATAPILASTSGSTFTLTVASGDTVAWIAWGIPNA